MNMEALKNARVPHERAVAKGEPAPGLSACLNRKITLSCFPVVGNVRFMRERTDLVALLRHADANTNKLPDRLVSLLVTQGLLSQSAAITERGRQLLTDGLHKTEEYGLYKIWYTQSDPILGTRPVLLQRDQAYFTDEMDCWLRQGNNGITAYESSGPLDVRVVTTDDARQLTSEKTVLSVLKPHVVCKQCGQEELTLTVRINGGSVEWDIEGELPAENPRATRGESKKIHLPVELSSRLDGQWGKALQTDVRSSIVSVVGARQWVADRSMEICYPAARDAQVSIDSLTIDSLDFPRLDTEAFGSFCDARIRAIPVAPESPDDALRWQAEWVAQFHNDGFARSIDFRDRQAAWLHRVAAGDIDLPPLSGQGLLDVLSDNGTQREVFWHAAAMQDLCVRSEPALRLPLSLRKGTKLTFECLVAKLTVNGSRISSVIISDRYTSSPSQLTSLIALKDCLPESKRKLLTAMRPNGRSGWDVTTFDKNPDNHGRYWVFGVGDKYVCWECSGSIDFLRNEQGTRDWSVAGATTFTPKAIDELPDYLQAEIGTGV